MNGIVIYTEDKNTLLKDFCERAVDLEVEIKSVNEIKNMELTGASLAVIDMPLSQLKDLSMVMKFPLPVLIVCDKIPDNITIRGEAYDFIVSPLSQYEINVRLKNLSKIKELKDKISNISTTDELTGLHNRKFLIERLESEMSRARRYNSVVSYILFDLDFFKVVNDMYGYEWGDVLLKKIAEMLNNLARKEDVVTRYGDEEFMVILPDTTEENANSIIRYAEHALYNAKKRGKNKIVLFSQVNLDF